MSNDRAARRRAARAGAKGPPPKMPSVAMEEVSAANSETGCNELYIVINSVRVAHREGGAWVVNEAGKAMDLSFFKKGDPLDADIIQTGEVRFFEEPKTKTRQ